MKKILLSSIALGIFFGSSAIADDFKGSIKVGLFDSEKKAMQKVTVSMIQAIEAAKKSVDGQVVKAKLDEEDDYLLLFIQRQYLCLSITEIGMPEKILFDKRFIYMNSFILFEVCFN